jgi:hypothetical protein
MEAKVFEEHAGLRQATAETGELFDSVGGFGNGADRCFGQGGFDRFGVTGQFTDGADAVARPQAVEAARAVRSEVALNGGPSHARDFGRLLTGEPRMHRPEGEHFAANAQVRVREPLGRDDGLFGLRESNRGACHP